MSLREEALLFHRENNGKLEMTNKVELKDGYDLSLAYTP